MGLEFIKSLQTMKAGAVVRNEQVRQQFITVYNSIWKEGGESVYEREAIYFNEQIREKADLQQCSGTSIYFAFIDLAVKGLTLQPGSQALCYLLPRNCKVGVDANKNAVWEKACKLTISGYGELALRTRYGQVSHADNPVIVYEGDEFSYGEKDGHKFVNYMSSFPRKSNKIVACFIKITRTDGTIDYSVMTESDWKRLEGFSDKQNTFYDRATNTYKVRKNELYGKNGGQIDAGFLVAKCIKHAFKTYPKLDIGKGSILESEVNDEPQAPAFDPYNVNGAAESAGAPEPKEDTFVPDPDFSKGVTINTEGSEDDGTF